jgi:hypothetical protein
MAPSGKLRLVIVCRYWPDRAIKPIFGTLSRALVVDYDSKSRVSNPVASNQSARSAGLLFAVQT